MTRQEYLGLRPPAGCGHDSNDNVTSTQSVSNSGKGLINRGEAGEFADGQHTSTTQPSPLMAMAFTAPASP